MHKKKRVQPAIRIVLDVLIAAFLLCFIFSLYWFLNGSFEMVPTEEQQEKALMGAGLMMTCTGIPCITCIFVRVKYGK